MEEKELVLKYTSGGEDNKWEEVENEEENIDFFVRDLWECPEDAVLGGDLFCADDYVSTLEKGMELARKGYTKIVFDDSDENEGEE